MRRRAIFGWLAGLPFIGKAIARPKQPELFDHHLSVVYDIAFARGQAAALAQLPTIKPEEMREEIRAAIQRGWERYMGWDGENVRFAKPFLPVHTITEEVIRLFAAPRSASIQKVS